MRASQIFTILGLAGSLVMAVPVEAPVTNIEAPINGTNSDTTDWQPSLVRFTTCPDFNYWPNGQGDYCVTQTVNNYACSSRNVKYPGPHLPIHVKSIKPAVKTVCWVYRNSNCYDFDGKTPLKVEEGGVRRLPDEFADNVQSMKCEANF